MEVKYTMIMEVDGQKYVGKDRRLSDSMASLINSVLDGDNVDHAIALARQVVRLTEVSILVDDMMQQSGGLFDGI